MSKYEWEHGTIKIPAKEWAKFRTAIITEWNRLQDECFELAKKVWPAVRKGASIDAELDKLGVYDIDRWNGVCHILTEWNHEEGKSTVRRPLKRNVDRRPTSKSATLRCGDGSIGLSNKSRSVTWDVPENNRACEDARKSRLGSCVFRHLDRITWVRGSGGTIVGNDEYNRDDSYEGGGANYVTAEYSVEASKRKREAARASSYRRWR